MIILTEMKYLLKKCIFCVIFLDFMNDEKRRLQSYLLDKNLSNGQVLSLFSTIDTGVTVDQIINGIENLGNITLSNTSIAKIKRISKK